MSKLVEQSPLRRHHEDESLDATFASTVNLVRSDIWYDDGSIVLQAEGTQFKAYKGNLAESSPFFKDMFSLPQPPPNDTEMIGGCPIVHLSDSAEELRYVLQAIFQRKYMVGEKLPLPVLSAFFCLGAKYDFCTLHQYDRVNLQFRFSGWREFQEPWEYSYTLFELLAIARKADLLSILPHLLYDCCKTFRASEILHGPEHRVNVDGAHTKRFPQEDQISCLAGHRAIGKAQA